MDPRPMRKGWMPAGYPLRKPRENDKDGDEAFLDDDCSTLVSEITGGVERSLDDYS